MVGGILDRIRAAKDGELTPDDVLSEASRPSSPLHSWFQWDDSVAAQAYRLDQARRLIRTVVVVYRSEGSSDEKMKTVRAYISVGGGEEERRYVAIVEAQSDRALRISILRSAYRELKAFQEKYDQVLEFERLFGEIKRIQSLVESE